MTSTHALPLLTAAFVASLCVVLLRPAAAQDLVNCHSCFESVTVKGSKCADPSASGGSLSTAVNCTRCQVSIYSNSSDKYYSRGCTDLPEGCTRNPSSAAAYPTRCVCTGNLCNNQVIGTNEVNIKCYECTSAAFIDNGCGKTLDKTSSFVTEKSGCTACGLTVSQNNDGSGYTRSCLTDVPDTNSCAFKEDPNNSGCTFRCTTELCNAANQRGPSSSVGLALAILVVAAMNKLF